MLLQLSQFPPSLHSILPTPSLPHSPPMSMGHTYKFFAFYISYTILTRPVYFPPIIYATYSLYFPPTLPLPLPCW